MRATAVPATRPATALPQTMHESEILAEHAAGEAAVITEAHLDRYGAGSAALQAALRRAGVYEPSVGEIETLALELERDPFKVARALLILEHQVDRLTQHITGLPQREELTALYAQIAQLDQAAQVAAERLNGEVGQRSIEELRRDVANLRGWTEV